MAKKAKWTRPKGYGAEYEEKRRDEGKRTRMSLKYLRCIVHEYLQPQTKKELEYAGRILCLLDMAFRRLSYRGYVSYLETNTGSMYMCGLKKVPSKSCLHETAKICAQNMELLQYVLLEQAGSDAHWTLLGDASGFATVSYANWEDAKRGIVSKRGFVKLHILVRPKGKIAACETTGGTVHDSPTFRVMFRRIPEGSGHVILDAAYDAHANCTLIERSGRTPVIWPKKNHVAHGYNARSRMLRWFDGDQEEFEKTYHQRSLVESVFSSMKERFTAVVRAKTAPMQRLQMALRCICYNIIA